MTRVGPPRRPPIGRRAPEVAADALSGREGRGDSSADGGLSSGNQTAQPEPAQAGRPNLGQGPTGRPAGRPTNSQSRAPAFDSIGSQMKYNSNNANDTFAAG